MNQFDKKQLIKRYLENNKKLQNNYKEINEIKHSIDNYVLEVPAKILSKEEIKKKSKDKKDKKEADEEDKDTDEDTDEEDTDEDTGEKDKDKLDDTFKYNLELDDGTIVQVDHLSPDSPRTMGDDTGENFIDEYTDVEKLFRKNKDRFNPDEEELCKQTVVWEELLKIKKATDYYDKLKEISTNPKYTIFNQVHFHAGDEQQFERYGFIKSRYLKYTEQYKENKELEIFNGYNLDTTYKTFEYIFNKLKKGIYVSFKNNKLDTYIPFSNINYVNNWSDVLEKSNPELVKEIIDKQKYGRKINVSDPSKWYANNCIFKTDSMKFKFKDYVSEGDKTVIPLKYFLIGFQNYMNKNNLELDDMDFFFNPRDFPILKKDYYEPYEQIFPDKKIEDYYQYKTFTPILSQSGNKNYNDLLAPTEDDMLRIK